MSGEDKPAESTPWLSHFGVPQFDSLSWARDEITDALVRARAALADVPPGLSVAEQSLTQAARALEVIGLDAERHILGAATQMVVAMLEASEGEVSEYSLALADEAIDAVNAALAARAAGQATQPLQWLPLYRQLRAAVGEAVRASDLFYPDINRRPAQLQTPPLTLPDYLLTQQAQFEHRRFERGMRAWMREPATAAGVSDMRRAAHAIERGQRLPAARAFWWVVTALFDGMLAGGLEATPELTQLIQSIDRQIRHLLTGAVRVPDGLMREVLYHLATATTEAAAVQAVREAYDLQVLLPSVEAGAAGASASPSQLDTAAAAFARALAGDAEGFEECCTAIESLTFESVQRPSLELGRVLGLCAEASRWLAVVTHRDGVDTRLLLQELESALGVLARGFGSAGQNDAELQRQGDLLAARLAEVEFTQAREHVRPFELTPPPLTRARPALLQTIVACFEAFEAGLQASLHQPLQRNALEALVLPLHDLDIALTQLGAQEARALVDTCTEGVRTLTEMGPEAEEAIFPALVRDVSALGEAIATLCAEAEPLSAPTIVLAGGTLAQAAAPAQALLQNELWSGTDEAMPVEPESLVFAAEVPLGLLGEEDSAVLNVSHDLNAALLNRSIEDATEIAIASVQMENEIQRLRDGVAELQQRASAIAAQVQTLVATTPQDAPVGAQEALAMLVESAQDLSALQRTLTRRAGRAEALLTTHARMQRDLHQELLDLRNVPIGALAPRLQDALSRLTQHIGVPVQLTFLGNNVGLPPDVLDGLGTVLENVLRVIAVPSAGLDATTRIDIEAAPRGHEISLAIGPVRPETVFDLGALRAALRALPFMPKAEVERVSRSGSGDTLRFLLPQPTAAIAAFIVSAGAARAAVPSNLVLHRQVLEGPALTQARAAGVFSWQGEAFVMRDLNELFAATGSPERRAQLLLMRTGKLRLALVCDAPVREREVVLKETPANAARVPGVIGATVFGDDEVVLLINPLTVSQCKSKPVLAEGMSAEASTRRVLLVDDSSTAREIGRSALEAAGFEVVAARSGGQALDCVRDMNFAAALIDSDMPGMDGLELARRLRADVSLSNLPIVMLSSRRTPEHRQAARMAGVDHYLTKPYEPQQLIALVESGVNAGMPMGSAVLSGEPT